MYPMGLDAEQAIHEHAARLERAQHAALIAEARRARTIAQPSDYRSGPLRPLGHAAAAWLRAASGWLATLADSLDAPVPALGRR